MRSPTHLRPLPFYVPSAPLSGPSEPNKVTKLLMHHDSSQGWMGVPAGPAEHCLAVTSIDPHSFLWGPHHWAAGLVAREGTLQSDCLGWGPALPLNSLRDQHQPQSLFQRNHYTVLEKCLAQDMAQAEHSTDIMFVNMAEGHTVELFRNLHG